MVKERVCSIMEKGGTRGLFLCNLGMSGRLAAGSRLTADRAPETVRKRNEKLRSAAPVPDLPAFACRTEQPSLRRPLKMSLLVRKYVQIFSLQRNISAMSLKNNLGEAHEKRLLHPLPERSGRGR